MPIFLFFFIALFRSRSVADYRLPARDLSQIRFLLLRLLLVAFIGSYVGKLALNKSKQENFRRIVLVLVFLIGLTLGKFLEQISR